MRKNLIIILLFLPIFLLAWQQIGPSGIKGRYIVVDKATGLIYALSYDYMHLYRVDEETNNWEEINLPNLNKKVNSFDVFDNRLYVTKDGYLYISENAGFTWTVQYFQNGYYEIFILKDHPNIILLQRYMNEWLRSTDYGNNWNSLGEIWESSVLYSEEYSILCLMGSATYFYKSMDLGETWEIIDCPFYSMDYEPNAGVILDENTYIVGGINSSSNFTQTIYETCDGGISWQCINNGARLALWDHSLVRYNNQIIVSSFLGYKENANTGLFKLNQENLAWEKFGFNVDSYFEGYEVYSSQDKLYWLSADEGIFVFEEDNETLNLTPTNIFRKDIKDIGFNIENSSSIYTSKNSLYLFDNTVGNWESQEPLIFNYKVIQTEQNPPKWLSSRKEGLFLSNNLEEWNPSMNGIEENDKIDVENLFKLDNVILCYGHNQISERSFIYKSSDYGQNWNLVLEGNENSAGTSTFLISTVKVEDQFYGIFLRKGVFITNDLGETWQQIFSFNESYFYFDEYFNGEYFYLLAQKASNGKINLYRTSDYVNWTNCTNGFALERGITDIAFDPNNPQKIYAGIRSFTALPSNQPHLMISDDAGMSWESYYIENLDHKADIIKVYTNAETNQLYVLPVSNSILTCNLDEMNFSQNILHTKKINISNHPNPFNPSTTISFSLAKLSKDTKIEIYNLKGQKVRLLDISDSKIGDNHVVWNGKNDNNKKVASGVYLYQLKQNGKTIATKKMIMVK